MNVRLDGPGTTDGSGQFVCGGSVPLRGEKRSKGCIRIVPNNSAFWKRNGCATAPSDGLAGKNIKLRPRCRAGSTPVPAKSSEFRLLPVTVA